MITETDALNSVEFEEYFVILPSTKLWDVNKFMNESNSSVGKMCEFGFSYNSESNHDFLTVENIRALIKENLNYLP